MKKSISKTLSIFADKVADDNDDISYDEIKDSSIKSMMAKIHQSANTTKNIIGKPFLMSMIYYAVLWIGALLVFLNMNYEFGF